MLILLSKSSLQDHYAVWLKKLSPGIELADAYSVTDEIRSELIHNCSGILLTGGGDVNPALYNNPAAQTQCQGIDDKRDKIEIELIRIAVNKQIPVLAICRGIQIINVYFGGTLIVDIQSETVSKIEHQNKEDVFHPIVLACDSKLFSYGKTSQFIVNSSHHQAIRDIGKGLVPVAWSNDQLVEAVEPDTKFLHPFFTGVQWHPERMPIESTMSGALGSAFLNIAAQK